MSGRAPTRNPSVTNAQQLASQAQAARAGSQQAAQDAYNAAKESEESEVAPYDYIKYYTSRTRTAWVLTTTRRQYMANQESDEEGDFEYGNSYQEFSSDQQWDDENAPLIFNVNPNSYQMDNPFRQNVVDTKGGPVIHTFRDPKRGYTNFGFATMNIEMSSGSMMPWAKYSTGRNNRRQGWTMPPSIGNFYRFLEIVQEDTVYERDRETLPNYQIIKMSTLLFPKLTLYGYFIQNANWSEQAENPTEVQNWQVQFKIYKTSPALTIDQIRQLYAKWEEDYNKMYVQP